MLSTVLEQPPQPLALHEAAQAQQLALLQQQLVVLQRERDQAVAQQHVTAQRLDNLLSILPAGVIVIDGRGVIREANPVACQLLRAPLVGVLWRDIIVRDFAPREDDGHEVSTVAGRRLSIAMSPLQGEPGQLLLLQDLTHTRQLQAQAAHSQRLSALGQMMASLAHQIRTPLSAALLYASHLAERVLPLEQQQRFALQVKDRLHELERQVRDMLIFAKADLPLQDQLAPLTLMKALKETCESLMSHRSVRWQCDVDGRLLCNRDMLVSALSNLLENALQAGDECTRYKVHFYAYQRQLRISISDSGAGIAPEVLAKLGEPFVTTKATGTGLGWPVVKAVTQAHGGQVRVRSRQGFGTCVSVILPLLTRTEA